MITSAKERPTRDAGLGDWGEGRKDRRGCVVRAAVACPRQVGITHVWHGSSTLVVCVRCTHTTYRIDYPYVPHRLQAVASLCVQPVLALEHGCPSMVQMPASSQGADAHTHTHTHTHTRGPTFNQMGGLDAGGLELVPRTAHSRSPRKQGLRQAGITRSHAGPQQEARRLRV